MHPKTEHILKESKRSAGRKDFTAVQQAGGRGAAEGGLKCSCPNQRNSQGRAKRQKSTVVPSPAQKGAKGRASITPHCTAHPSTFMLRILCSSRLVMSSVAGASQGQRGSSETSTGSARKISAGNLRDQVGNQAGAVVQHGLGPTLSLGKCCMQNVIHHSSC